MNYIDISYPINTKTAIYPGNPSFELERVQDINRGDSASVSKIIMGTHTGTHIDAPAHFIQDGETIDMIPPDRMNGRAKVIDATGYKDIDTEFLSGIDIEPDDILLFKTDNSAKWECDRILDEYVTLTYESAEYLVNKGIKLVGIDYLTIERPRNHRISGRSVHKTILGNRILIIEAINLADINAGEYELFCFPLNITGLDGCPIRCMLREYQ